ncbi:iron complex outermembrane receptor protein [Algoriphagus sp. 4150]|uniref:TonB-dependent siderophore receptor n=1 Tax=Algoriphagus sp. 4150 TaxID=2817756 RepID=UPI002855DEA9|nr:TonB-dependent siderophore receptor [Algoriphagus sp. 4150]MDR7132570.1 iron complex outermembrane receptor protein [Algoriphagus sp. 4150]
MKFTLLFFLFLNGTGILAQVPRKVEGRIQATDQTPLVGMTVHLLPINKTTFTNEQGEFRFTDIAAGTYSLVVTGVGFEAKSVDLVVGNKSPGFLQLALDLSTESLKEVTVSASLITQPSKTLTRMDVPLLELPQNVQTISRTVISDQQLFQLDDVLKNVAGFSSPDYYGGVSTRGYTSGASGITTNGIKGTPYSEGQIALLGNIEAVEVIHGPNAIMFGPGGMGGNINLVTKQPKPLTTVNATLTGGSFGLFRPQMDVSGALNNAKSIYAVAGVAYQRGGSFTRDFDRENIQIYGSVKWELSPKTSWQINTNLIRDDVSNNYQPRVPIYNTLNPDSIFLAPYDLNPGTDSRYKGNNIQVQSVMEHHFSTDWKLGFLAAYNESRSDREQYSASGYINVEDNTVDRSYAWQKINSPQTSLNLYGIGKAETLGMEHKFSMGTDVFLARNKYPDGMLMYSATPLDVFNPVYESRYDTTGMTKYYDSRIEDFTYNTLGAYVMDQITLLEKLKLLAGLRYNNYFRRFYAENRDGSVLYDERPSRTENFSPRLGLLYLPYKTVSVYLDYNEGFSPHYGNYPDRGGPFDPETSKQFELGVKGEFFEGSLFPFLNLYQSTKKNVLQTVPREGFPYWQEAIGEVRSTGAEIGVSGTVLTHWWINFNYSHNKTEITESQKPEEIGQEFANTPKNSANGWLKYTFAQGPVKGLFAGGGFQYVGMRYFANRKVGTEVAENPAYTLFDTFIGYRYAGYGIQLNANNMLDKRYALSGSYGAYTPGMPRNLQVSLTYTLR